MKDEESQLKSSTTTLPKKYGSVLGGLFGRGRYKFWALAAILLLAFWSMLTGSVTLKWSAGNLNPLSDDFDSPVHNDLDILEVGDREKVVRHMWDVYSHSSTIRLPRFWQEAFEAAYEDLTSDIPDVRNSAVSEIAKMSLLSLDIESPAIETTVIRAPVKEKQNSKQAREDKKESITTNGTVK